MNGEEVALRLLPFHPAFLLAPVFFLPYTLPKKRNFLSKILIDDDAYLPWREGDK
jgi:hypothetical protein